MMRLENTPESIAKWAACMMEVSRGAFERDGYLQHVTLLLVTADPTTGEPLPPGEVGMTTVAPESLADENMRDRYALAVREAARRGRAFAVLQLAEVWIGIGPAALSHIGRMAECPGRTEALTALLSTPQAQRVYVSQIRREGDKATAEPWEAQPDMVLGGRMAEVFRASN